MTTLPIALSYSIYAGGPGSGCKGSNCGRPSTGRSAPLSSRAARALATYVPVTKDKLRLSKLNESLVAQAIGGEHSPFMQINPPFDIVTGKIGIEVKTVFPGVKNNKITMHPESRDRKFSFMKKNGLKRSYTVIVDMRDAKIYVGEGLKSFRFNMGGVTQVKSFADLKKVIK